MMKEKEKELLASYEAKEKNLTDREKKVAASKEKVKSSCLLSGLFNYC